MALIKISDLMVVQKIDGVENPVVSFTIDDLHKSLAEFDDKVSKTGDVMSGQLEIRMTDADIPPLLLTRLPGYDPVMYFSIKESSLVFEDSLDSRIQKNNADLYVTVDGKDLVTFGENHIVTSHVDIELKGDFGNPGSRITGLEWPEFPAGVTKEDYQATNVGYVKNEISIERIERENNDSILQTQIDILKSYLDLFAKFSLQGNYIYDLVNDTHPLPPIKHFTVKTTGANGLGIPGLYEEIEEITIHEEATDVSNNPIVLDLINEGDFIGINPVSPTDPELVDRSEFGVYQIITAADAISHDAANRTYTFKVVATASYPTGSALSDNNTPHKIRIIRNPGEGALTRFEAEQIFISRIQKDNAEDHIRFDRGVTLFGRGAPAIGATGPIAAHNSIIDIPEFEVYGGLNINTKGDGPVTVSGVVPSDNSIIVKSATEDLLTIDGYGSLIFDSSNIQHLSSVGTSDFNFTHNGNTVFSMTLDTEPLTVGSVLSLALNRITNLADPINDLDAINKQYLESYIPVDEYVHKTQDNVISGGNQFVSPDDDIKLHVVGATGPSAAGNKAGTLQFIGGGNPGESIAKIVVNNRLTETDFVDISLDTSNQIVSNFKSDIIQYNESTDTSPLFTINRSANTITSQTVDRVQYHGDITEPKDIVNKEYIDAQAIPVGIIWPYMGTTAPSGWMMCDGTTPISLATHPILHGMVGDRTPDLRGRFLGGVGLNGLDTLGTLYEDTTRKPRNSNFTQTVDTYHRHEFDIKQSDIITSEAGNHSHDITDNLYVNKDNKSANSGNKVNYNRTSANGGSESSLTTNTVGKHTHEFDIEVNGIETDYEGSKSNSISSSNWDAQTRPPSYAVNYIIKHD